MDYTKLLGKRDELVLPWFGGPTLSAPSRGLRLRTEPPAPGWYRFSVRGRAATPLGPSDPDPDALAALPRARGHLLGVSLVGDAGLAEDLFFLPEDEPPLFSPASARRWPTGELVFEQLEFEGEAEEAVRCALEEERSLTGLKGVPASLRAAYAFAVVDAAARRLQLPTSPLEVGQRVGELAEGGPTRADDLVRWIAEQREQRAPGWATRPAARPIGVLTEEERDTARVDEALRSAGASLLRLRRMSDDQLEVTYRFLGSRFQALVVRGSLHVVDAGVCLDGEDGRLTLDSLPPVIREAVDKGLLYVTRRVSHDD
jgi:hypothetical protein